MAPCKVCSKDIPVAAHGIKAIVRHSGRSKHLKKMPKTSQPSILAPYASNNPKTVETMPIESSEAKSITRDKTQTVLVSSTSQNIQNILITGAQTKVICCRKCSLAVT